MTTPAQNLATALDHFTHAVTLGAPSLTLAECLADLNGAARVVIDWVAFSEDASTLAES